MPRLAPGSTQDGNPIGHIGQITQGAIHAALSLPHTPVSLNARAFPDRMVPARQGADSALLRQEFLSSNDKACGNKLLIRCSQETPASTPGP